MNYQQGYKDCLQSINKALDDAVRENHGATTSSQIIQVYNRIVEQLWAERVKIEMMGQ